MGRWGIGLYQNDLAQDMKESYLTMKKRGQASEEVFTLLCQKFRFALGDPDDEPIFWLVLRDLQIKAGIQNANVKEKADFYIQEKKAPPDQIANDVDHINKTDKPSSKKKTPSKKTAQPFCWRVGDVYALPICGEYADLKGFSGRWFLFHIIDIDSITGAPVARAKITAGNMIPTSADAMNSLEYVVRVAQGPIKEISPNNKAMFDDLGYGFTYRFLLFTSKREIPKELIYAGNYPDLMPPHPELIPQPLNLNYLAWQFATKILIDRYCLFNLRQSSIFQK